MKIIVINNPAAKNGGALSILRELLEKISMNKCSNIYHVIVSQEELKKYENDKLKIYVISVQSFKNRIKWDNYLLKKFLNKNKIKADIFISLQNTGVNIDKKIPQIIYYHQSLTLSEKKWNILKKDERTFWMYKNLYKFFIKQYLKRVNKIIVQTDWVREEFSKKFNYKLEDIFILKPTITKIDINKVKNIAKNKYRIFYPASPLIYKNHRFIIENINEIKKMYNIESYECIFSFFKEDNLKLDKLIEEKKLQDKVKYVGKLKYKEVLEYYKSSDLMIFPSYIETYGLPLVEAQQFNLKILALDLAYVREACDGYENIKYWSDNERKSFR